MGMGVGSEGIRRTGMLTALLVRYVVFLLSVRIEYLQKTKRNWIIKHPTTLSLDCLFPDI